VQSVIWGLSSSSRVDVKELQIAKMLDLALLRFIIFYKRILDSFSRCTLAGSWHSPMWIQSFFLMVMTNIKSP
jgi:hypothetical protein